MRHNTFIMLTALLLAALVLTTTGCHRQPAPQTQPTEIAAAETTAPQIQPVETDPTTAPTTAPTEAPTVATEPQPETFTLTFVGDCTLASDPGQSGLPSSFLNTVGTDYDYPFRNVVSYFENDDFTMVNLECVFGEEGYTAPKTFNFRGPAEYVNILTGSSVEAVTLANNHSRDYGQPGYDETKRILDEAGMPYVERDASTLITTESGLTIGLYAVQFVIDQADLEAEVAALREQGADIVVFAVHWGTEGAYRPHALQSEQAYAAIDAGVDIVYGSHPHVLQKIEEYNGGIIYYSLGNFSFGGNHYPSDMDTAILQQQVIREVDGTVHLGELTIIPCSISSIPVQNNFQPIPYPEDHAGYERVMSKLNGSWDGKNLSVNYSPITPDAPTEPPATTTPTTPTVPTTPPADTPTEGGTGSGGAETGGTEAPAPEPTPEPSPEPTLAPDPAPDTGSET